MTASDYGFKIEKLYEEDRTSPEKVEEVKSWLATADLPKLSDELVGIFLISCDNDLDKTRKTVLAHYNCKRDGPELFDNRDMASPDLVQIAQVIECSVMPQRTPEGYAVYMIRLKNTKSSVFNVDRIVKLSFMCLDLPLHRGDPNRGLVVLIDTAGLGLFHLTKFRLGVIKKCLQYVQEGLTCQLKAIHILNCVYFFDKILAILRPFMSEHLYKMMIMHSPGMDMDKFFAEHVPASCVPKDYGGELCNQSELSKNTYEHLRELESYFRIEEQQRKQNKSGNNSADNNNS